jgi:hypothetical protein
MLGKKILISTGSIAQSLMYSFTNSLGTIKLHKTMLNNRCHMISVFDPFDNCNYNTQNGINKGEPTPLSETLL